MFVVNTLLTMSTKIGGLSSWLFAQSNAGNVVPTLTLVTVYPRKFASWLHTAFVVACVPL